MKILSIETSCDDTGISILEVQKNNSFKILANVLHSQIKIHSPYGGVFPALAKREHIKNLPILLEKALKKAKLPLLGDQVAKSNGIDPVRSRPRKASATGTLGRPASNGIDLITVTSGPGLEPALWTGIVFAKELSKKLKIPLMPTNHMEGHLFSVFIKNGKTFTIPKIEFPALSLLVSGGHTELVLIKNWHQYKIIGETLDDAAGEAFDKVARMLELRYPGGPEVSRLAEIARKNLLDSNKGKQVSSGVSSATARELQQFSSKKIAYPKKFCLPFSPNFILPRPMLHSKNLDFSFSGLKTAVLYLIRDLKKENPNILQDENIKKTIALEFENAVVETLVYKTKKAIEKYSIKTLIVGGGVSANKYLKKEITRLCQDFEPAEKNLNIYFPSKKLSGDNALMIAVAGYLKYISKNKKVPAFSKIQAEGGLRL
jgi:N6-L-threonylcarbamoyladenine synthase